MNIKKRYFKSCLPAPSMSRHFFYIIVWFKFAVIKQSWILLYTYIHISIIIDSKSRKLSIIDLYNLSNLSINKWFLLMFLSRAIILVGNKMDMERGRQVSHQGWQIYNLTSDFFLKRR